MKSGELRHRFILQSKTATRNSFGAETIVYKTEKTVWASIEPLAGSEYFLAQQVQADVTHRVKIRYFEGIRPDWRGIFGTRIFDIKSIINLGERNNEMVLMTKEFVT